MVADPEEWIEAHMQGGREVGRAHAGIGAGAGTWRERALRAEASADAARALGYMQGARARTRGSGSCSARWPRRTESISWRIPRRCGGSGAATQPHAMIAFGSVDRGC